MSDGLTAENAEFTDNPDVPAHEQAIINALMLLFEDADFLNDISWYLIPTYDAVTMKPPWGMLFFQQNTRSDRGSANNFRYDGQIKILIGVPQHEVNSKSRRIYRMTETIDNILIRNRQPNIEERPDLRMGQWVLGEWGYETEPEGMEGVDTTLMTINVNYDRTVRIGGDH